MKRIIGLLLFYLAQFILMILFLVPSFSEYFRNNVSFLVNLWDFYKSILNIVSNIFNLNMISSLSSRIINMLSSIILNFIVTMIYCIIVLILDSVFTSIRRKKLKNIKLDRYSLSEEEKNRFDYRLFERKFSFKGMLSYLIPIFIIFILIVIRFDRTICLNDNYREGYFDIYSREIRPFLNSIHPDIVNVIEAIFYNYIIFFNKTIEIVKLDSIEYILFLIIIFLLFVTWSACVLIASKLNHKRSAKIRAYKAKKKYITKMEKLELKAKLKSEKRISSKAEEFVGEDVKYNSIYEDASSISLIEEKNSEYNYKNRIKEAEYIDDISTGVTDLGIVSNSVEDEEPVERKIPIFINDEDVDIVLDKEPFVEVEEEYDDYEEDVMPFFEKYSPELSDLSFINDSLLETQIEVEEEYEEHEELIYSNINNINEIDKDNQNSETPIKVEENEIIEEKIEPKEIIVKKSENKKNIKPINIKRKFTDDNRFKNARKKYLQINSNINDNLKKENIKKRNLIRRKYKK